MRGETGHLYSGEKKKKKEHTWPKRPNFQAASYSYNKKIFQGKRGGGRGALQSRTGKSTRDYLSKKQKKKKKKKKRKKKKKKEKKKKKKKRIKKKPLPLFRRGCR